MITTGRLRAIAAGLAGAGCVLLAAGCGNGTAGLASVGSTTSAAPSTAPAGSTAQAGDTRQAGSTAQATPSAAAAAAPGQPLKLADFPVTKDGDLARKICQAWAGLRGQYYSRVKSDTSSQLSQWFSGPDWTTVHADGLQLTADRAYIHLGASLGVAMAGSAASAKTGQAVDRACSSGT